MQRVPLQEVRVVGLGQACVDYLGLVPVYPPEDGKVELTGLHRQCGGPASTAMVTLSRLGVPTAFLGSVSDDPLGREIIRQLKQEGVNTDHLKITPGYTSQFAFIAVHPETGSRTIFWHRGSVPHPIGADVDLGLFPGARILHLDGLMIDASLEAAGQARERGIKVVLDAGTMREGSRELVSLVDVLIASRGFAESVTGKNGPPERAVEVLSEWGPEQVVVTLGAGGSLGRCRQGLFRQEAYPVKVVDTTGAGDVYHGGYIYGLLQGWEMPGCMRFASATAALKCRKIGARQGIPALHEVEDLIGKKSESFPLQAPSVP